MKPIRNPHLVGAAPPILGREGVYREVLDAEFDCPQVMSMRTASPILWPSVRLRPRWVAHRPLPSMTTATCLGSWSAGIAGGDALEGAAAVGADRRRRQAATPGRPPAGWTCREDRVVVRRRGQLRELLPCVCAHPHRNWPPRSIAMGTSCLKIAGEWSAGWKCPRSTGGSVRSWRSRCHCRWAATSPLAWLRCDEDGTPRPPSRRHAVPSSDPPLPAAG